MSVKYLSVSELKHQLETRDLSAVEVTNEFLEQIDSFDSGIGAFLSVRREQALARAHKIDSKRAAGEPLGLLAGIPIAVKDLLCVRGEVTTCGSRMLENFKPPYNATAIERLQSADAIILGKLNLDEFAMGGSTENSALRETRNPWDTSRVPGGSSGGSAACISASMAPLALGTDTGGSIRQPAAFCGVTGLKPSYGRVSRYGLVAFASSLDQIGPLARTVEDIALLLEAVAGHDPKDSTSASLPTPHYSQTVSKPLKGIRLGIAKEHFGKGVEQDVLSSVQEAIQVYESLGASVHEISLPHNQYGIAAYYIIAPCEASSNLARYDGVHYGYRTDEAEMLAELTAERKQLEEVGDEKGLFELDSSLVRMYRRTRAEGFGSEVKRRIMLGTYALSAGYYDAYYLKASRVRRLIRLDYDEAFQQVDFIIGPVTPTPAFKIGEMANDPLKLYLQDLFTVGANLAGISSISLPCGFTKNHLPIGLQLQAPPFEEERLLRGANMFQQATDWHTRRPELS